MRLSIGCWTGNWPVNSSITRGSSRSWSSITSLRMSLSSRGLLRPPSARRWYQTGRIRSSQRALLTSRQQFAFGPAELVDEGLHGLLGAAADLPESTLGRLVLQLRFGQRILEFQFREATEVVVGAVQGGVVLDGDGGQVGIVGGVDFRKGHLADSCLRASSSFSSWPASCSAL